MSTFLFLLSPHLIGVRDISLRSQKRCFRASNATHQAISRIGFGIPLEKYSCCPGFLCRSSYCRLYLKNGSMFEDDATSAVHFMALCDQSLRCQDYNGDVVPVGHHNDRHGNKYGIIRFSNTVHASSLEW